MSTTTSEGKQRGSILRLPAVLARTGRSRTSWYEDIAAGRAPIGVRIGPRAVGWFEEDIEQWMNNRTPAPQAYAVAVRGGASDLRRRDAALAEESLGAGVGAAE